MHRYFSVVKSPYLYTTCVYQCYRVGLHHFWNTNDLHRLFGEYKMLNFTSPFTRHRLVVRKRVRSQWSISTMTGICTIASSSSSGAVFFEKVGCRDPPSLPILSNSHEVLVSHSRPFCDVCRSLHSSLYYSVYPSVCVVYHLYYAAPLRIFHI